MTAMRRASAEIPLLIELRTMRIDIAAWILSAELVLSVMLLRSPDGAMVAGLFLERVCPLLFVPVFSSVLMEDRRRGTYEFVASSPGAWRVQARRLAVVCLLAVGTCAVLGVIWSPAARLSVLGATVVALGPTLMLGAIAYVVSVLMLSETAAIAVAVGVWAAQQSPRVAALFTGPFASLYLFPLSGQEGGNLIAMKVGIALASVVLLVAGVFALEPAARR